MSPKSSDKSSRKSRHQSADGQSCGQSGSAKEGGYSCPPIKNSWRLGKPALPPRQLVKYYQDVEKAMGGPEQTRDFARLFTVPGSSGCPAFSNPTGFKTFEALQAWVEEGKAPDRIIYPHTKGGGLMGGETGEVYRTRPVCAYPKQARYKGTGDINDAANFECNDPIK